MAELEGLLDGLPKMAPGSRRGRKSRWSCRIVPKLGHIAVVDFTGPAEGVGAGHWNRAKRRDGKATVMGYEETCRIASSKFLDDVKAEGWAR